MMGCEPPMPGKGINITVSIDIGDMLGCKQGMQDKPYQDDECDKLTYFNEANRSKKSLMGDAIDGVRGKFGKPKEKGRPFDGSSFSGEGDSSDEKKDEEENEES